MESAAISARMGADRAVRATEDLVDQIFSQLAALEDTILAGRNISKSLADPVSRIDNGGPTFPPDLAIAQDEVRGESYGGGHLIGKLERIRDRVCSLRDAQEDANKITNEAFHRLNNAV